MYTYLNGEQDFKGDGEKLLPIQFYEKENINTLISIFCERLQNVRNIMLEISNDTLLDTASGEQLDEIGRQINIYRLENQDDEQYRAMLWLFIQAQLSEGTRDDIVNLLKKFTGGRAVWVYKGFGPFVDVNMFSWCIGTHDYAKSVVDLFPVNTNLRLCTHGRGHFFGFEGGGEFVSGFGSTTLEEGFETGQGGLASLIYSRT